MSIELRKKKLPKIVRVEKELNEELLKYFKGERDGYVQVGPKKWFYPMKYEKTGQDFIDFEVRPDDVWIAGIPRSGTTVTQELAWLLANNLDFESTKIPNRVTFFERNMVFNEKTLKERLTSHKSDEIIQLAENLKNNLTNLNKKNTRRVMKTHLPFELLPPDIFNKGCKVIYICRYPKDVAVSYFFLQSKSWHINFEGDFLKYWNFFQNGNCMFGPYFEHVKQGLEKKKFKNFLFVFYEDLRKDIKKYIQTFSEFFERPVSDEEMEKLLNYLNFDNFLKHINILKDKNNEKTQFIRKGVVGGWKEHFTAEMNERADKWIEENTKKLGFSYPDH